MNKKVVMINGSFRKKNTYKVLEQIAEILKDRDIEAEIINLFDHEIKDCTGCNEVCMKQGSCNVKDDMPMIRQKILDSDGLVLGSPVYLGNVSSKFKAFADRTNEWYYKPEPAGKPVLLVVTTAITGTKDTLHFLDQFVIGLGARKGGSITRTGANIDVPVQRNEIMQFLSLLQTDKKDYKPKMNELVTFQVQKILAYNSTEDENRFWKEKDWLDKHYYYDCRVNFAKKAYANLIYKIISGALKDK